MDTLFNIPCLQISNFNICIIYKCTRHLEYTLLPRRGKTTKCRVNIVCACEYLTRNLPNNIFNLCYLTMHIAYSVPTVRSSFNKSIHLTYCTRPLPKYTRHYITKKIVNYFYSSFNILQLSLSILSSGSLQGTITRYISYSSWVHSRAGT